MVWLLLLSGAMLSWEGEGVWNLGKGGSTHTSHTMFSVFFCVVWGSFIFGLLPLGGLCVMAFLLLGLCVSWVGKYGVLFLCTSSLSALPLFATSLSFSQPAHLCLFILLPFLTCEYSSPSLSCVLASCSQNKQEGEEEEEKWTTGATQQRDTRRHKKGGGYSVRV